MLNRKQFPILLSAVLVATAASAQTISTSPSTTVEPYVRSHLSGVAVESILTVDDGEVPKTGGGTTRLVGIPDGMGAFDGSDLTPAEPDYFYLLVNHEINTTQGIVRDHGAAGSYVSKWKVDKVTHEVVEGDDLIKQSFAWDEATSTFSASTRTYDRLCSADLPPPSALFNSATGLGSNEMIYLNGEESSASGYAFGHVVTGPDAGNSYHLHHLGYSAFENVVLNPFEQDKTIVALTDDESNGEVYFYVGTKQADGNEVEKAGLVGGNLYALAVVGKPFEMDNVIATAVGRSEEFTLKLIGEPGDRPVDIAETEARGLETTAPVDPTQPFESLKMGGPEDSVWDDREGFENIFHFVTKGTSSNSLNAPTRFWKAEFDDITNPEQGGTLTLLLDGPANRLGSLDNMTVEVIDGAPKVYLQEDLGGDSRLSKIWEYDVDSGRLVEILDHDPALFSAGGANFLTENEESSGIVSLKEILGEGWFAVAVQAHTSTGLSDTTELVEHGQLVLFNIADRGTDVLREKLVASGDEWIGLTDGTDPGPDWANAGAMLVGNWMAGLPTPIGYGESDGVLATDVIQPDQPRPAAYYFRHEFDLADPDAIALFDLYMKVDDGAVVYINGVEVARYNMNLGVEISNDTFASANEPAERDWKQIPVSCTDIPLQTTGNVLAVTIRQENSGSSDIRFDAEMFAWNASPDGGFEPAVPVNLLVGNAAETELELTWDAQSDTRFFRIERQLSGDLAWETVAAERPGEFTSFLSSNLNSGTEYNYRMSAVNSHGRSACSAPASGQTVASALTTAVEEDFEAGDFGIFDLVDVLEPGAGWSWITGGFGGSGGAAQGNGFGADGPTEDWLITREPVDLVFFRNTILQYQGDLDFSGPAVELLYSSDYDPAIHADPNEATWTQLQSLDSGSGSFETQGPFDVSAIGDRVRFAFKYTSAGGAGGESVRFTIDNFLVAGDCGFDFEGGEDSDLEDDPSTPWTVVNLSSELGWLYDTQAGIQGAINNNFGSDAGGITGGTVSDDWLISPAFSSSDPNTLVTFEYYENFGDTLDTPLRLLVTDAYTGDPTTTNWTDITPTGLNGSTSDAYIPVTSQFLGVTGSELRLAYHYTTAGNSGGTTKRIGVDLVCVTAASGPLEVEISVDRDGATASFLPLISGGVPPYTFNWDFGDGNTSTEQAPSHEYALGSYTATLTLTDADGVQQSPSVSIVVSTFMVPTELGDLRVATYNASMNRNNAGDLAVDLASGTNSQIQEVAEVIQRANPDVLLVNEFDHLYDANGDFDLAATQAMIDDFRQNYLEVAQTEEAGPISFTYSFVAANNTGVPVEFDFNNDGDTDDPDDAYGFGFFPGQFAMIVLSKYPIEESEVRTFQKFLWKDMPDAFLPADPADTDGDGDTSSYYNAEELEVFRLSSKSHWDIPIDVDGQVLHLLTSHPTPPVFDDGTLGVDGEVADWNGLRNHHEIRFWADYIDPESGGYIYDDAEWDAAGESTPESPNGGLAEGERFVILGDQNADPIDGDATFNPIAMLLQNDRINTSITPRSAGALEQVPVGSNRDEKTANFNLRADYVLPSVSRLMIEQAFVFWPVLNDIESSLLSASDHRMVAVDLSIVDMDLFLDPDQPLYNSGILGDGGVPIPSEFARVWRMYRGSLAREPDQEGFDFYIDEVASGRKSLTDVAADFIASPEFVELADSDSDGTVSNEELLNHVYTVFGRAPDETGFNYWLDQLDTGGRTQAEALEGMLHSDEYVVRTSDELSQSAVFDTLVQIRFLNVSDWHAQLDPLFVFGEGTFGGAAELSTYFQMERADNPNTLTLTAGDAYGGSPPLSNFFDEETAVLSMNLMGFDVDTFGNHNFDGGIEFLQNLINLADFQYVSANLENRDDNLSGVKDFEIFVLGGVSVGVIGITNPEAPTLVFPGSFGTIIPTDPITAANEAMASARAAGARVLVAITHLGVTGFDDDGNPFGPLIDFASNVSGFDIIFGDHTNVEFAGIINNALVVENRSRGRTYARVNLTVDLRDDSVADRRVDFVDPVSDAVTPDPDIVAFLDPLREELNVLLGNVIGESTVFIPRADECGQSAGRTCESLLGDVVTDAMRTTYETDFAITNSGGLRADLTCPLDDVESDFCPPNTPPNLQITDGQVLTVLPFGNVIATLTLDGAELKDFLENGVSSMPGVSGRFAQVSGLCFTYSIDAAAGSRVTEAVRQAADGSCTGAPVDLTSGSTYTLAINDFMAAGGDDYPDVSDRIVTRNVMDADIAAHIVANTPISPAIQGRITCVGNDCPTPSP